MGDEPRLPQGARAAPQAPPADQEPGEDLGLERIVFFSDAVIAIAITLLALEIRLPELQGNVSEALPRALAGLGPRYFSFAISFLVVGSYWWVHHRMFRVIRRYDDTLIWLTILFLLCVAFIPFASAVLGEHGDQRSAAVFYSLVIIATGLVETLLWVYAARGHRLVEAGLSPRAIRLATLRQLTAPAVFLVALPLVLLHPYVAMAAWAAIYPLTTVLRRAERSATHESREAVTKRVATRRR